MLLKEQTQPPKNCFGEKISCTILAADHLFHIDAVATSESRHLGLRPWTITLRGPALISILGPLINDGSAYHAPAYGEIFDSVRRTTPVAES